MKEEKKKCSSIIKGSKKIHIRGDLWYWKYTRSGIFLLSPEFKKSFVRYKDLLLGWTHYDIERAMNKRCFHIEPHDVKNYIERTFYATKKK